MDKEKNNIQGNYPGTRWSKKVRIEGRCKIKCRPSHAYSLYLQDEGFTILQGRAGCQIAGEDFQILF